MGSPMRLADGTWRQDKLGGDSDSDWEDCDGIHNMAEEDYRNDVKQVEESGGFDVFNENALRGKLIDNLNALSKLALDHYNNNNQGTNWKLKEVIKVNSGGFMFYITFIARDDDRNLLQAFQAKVYDAEFKFQVDLCRPVDL